MPTRESSKIRLYKLRTAGEVIGDTFAFVTDNFKVLFKYFSFLLLPVCLLLAYALNGYVDAVSALPTLAESGADIAPSAIAPLLGQMAFYVVSVTVALLLLASLTFAMIRHYEVSEQGLLGVRWSGLKPLLKVNMKRMLVLLGLSLLLSVLLGAFVAGMALLIRGWSALMCFIIIVILMGPLVLLTPIYVLEDETTVWGTIKKALRLGMSIWGKVVGVILVVAIVCIVIQGIFSLPWCVLFMAKMVFGVEGGTLDAFVNTFGFSVLEYLSALLQSFSYLFAYMVIYVCEAFLYGHAVEKERQQNADSDY